MRFNCNKISWSNGDSPPDHSELRKRNATLGKLRALHAHCSPLDLLLVETGREGVKGSCLTPAYYTVQQVTYLKMHSETGKF